MDNLIQVKNKETDDILWLVKNGQTRYIDGEEYIEVRRYPEDRQRKFIKRKSLIFHWK